MEVIVLRRHRGLALRLPLLVDEVPSLGQTTAAILRRLTQVGQLPELLSPFFTVATRGEPACVTSPWGPWRTAAALAIRSSWGKLSIG